MHVLIISQYFWPENFLINHLVSLLTERGIEVTVLTGKPNYPEGKIFEGYKIFGSQTEFHNNAKVVRVPIIPRGKNSKLQLAFNYLSFIISARLLGGSLLKDDQFDLVFVYAPSPLLQALPAIYFAKKQGIPAVTWVQDLWPETLTATAGIKNKWIIETVAKLVRYIYKFSSLILVQSQAFIQPVAKLTDNTKKIKYFPNFYTHDSEHVAKVSDNAKSLIEDIRKNFSIIFTGNLGSAQSLETIIKAANLLKNHNNIKIFLIGSGSLDLWLAREKQKLQLSNLILAGRYEPSDMPYIFEAAKGLLVTLRADTSLSQTIPSKVQAYMSSGKPIVAAINGEGARIIKESGAGLCSSAEDEYALMKNLLKLASLPEGERNAIGLKAKEYYNLHFSPDKLVEELIMHFKGVISKMGKNK